MFEIIDLKIDQKIFGCLPPPPNGADTTIIIRWEYRSNQQKRERESEVNGFF